MGLALHSELLTACRRLEIPVDVPWQDLEAEQQKCVLEGDSEDWSGVRGFFDWLEGRRYKVQARVLIARYRRAIIHPVVTWPGSHTGRPRF